MLHVHLINSVQRILDIFCMLYGNSKELDNGNCKILCILLICWIYLLRHFKKNTTARLNDKNSEVEVLKLFLLLTFDNSSFQSPNCQNYALSKPQSMKTSTCLVVCVHALAPTRSQILKLRTRCRFPTLSTFEISKLSKFQTLKLLWALRVLDFKGSKVCRS